MWILDIKVNARRLIVKDPIISIIVPVYNSANYLEDCLYSIKKQTYSNIEVILVDDGSIDCSRDICQKFVAEDERFHLYVQPNKGASVARNNGLQRAAGKYISFVDSDDVVDDKYIEILYMAIKNSNVDISVCNYCFFSSKLPQKTNKPFVTIVPVDESIFKINIIARVCGCMFSKEILKHLKFDINLYVGEDLLFFCSTLKRVNKIAISSHVLYFYRLYGDSACHGKYTYAKYTEVMAWLKVRDLFFDEKNILQKINSMFGGILLGQIRGLLGSNYDAEKVIYVKKLMKNVFYDFMTVSNPNVKLRHRLLYICMLVNEKYAFLLYEKVVDILKR